MDFYKLDSPEEKSRACSEIIERLPDWFGLPDSNKQYIEDAKVFPALAAKSGNEVKALLVYKKVRDDILNAEVANIHWLGALPEYHRSGIGRKLVQLLEHLSGEKTLTVETLDPALRDESYLKTYLFYANLGFQVYHHFKYSEENQMVRMCKILTGK